MTNTLKSPHEDTGKVTLTEDEIIAYAKKRGVVDPRIVHHVAFGAELVGGGKLPVHDYTDENGKEVTRKEPAVWVVCQELGISYGCGGTTGNKGYYHQIKLPKEG